MEKAERIRTKGLPLVCAVDQRPFLSKRNRFTILVPLMGSDRTVFHQPEEEFPNRGRIWWMLNDGIEDQMVLPGALFTVLLDQAVDPDLDDPEKDQYQVRVREVTPGARHCYEILRLDGEIDSDRLLADGLQVDGPVNPRVLVLGPRSMTGPFEATWNRGDHRIDLKATASNPIVYRADRPSVPQGILHDLTFVSNRWDKRYDQVRVNITLVHEDDVDELLEKGDHLDGMDETKLLNWGLKRAQITNKQRQMVKEALQQVTGTVPTTSTLEAHRLTRFRELLSSRERLLALGEDAALAIRDSQLMREFTERHLAPILADRIKDEVARRSSEVEEALSALKERKDRLDSDVRSLERLYAERKQAQDLELDREHAAHLRAIQDRERLVEDKEKTLSHREKEIADRLQRLIDQYRNSAGQLTDRILADLPILKALGLGPSVAGAPGSPGAHGGPLPLPAFLNRKRERTGLSEKDFVAQFADVVAQRGFQFDPDDLANFHVSVKTGLWTVLTGPSGTGKSSLPRLYAEALGVEEEFLTVAVRPDWVDDRDVTGAYNALSGTFEPAPTGLVDRLIAACEDRARGRGGIYLVCLDEMNLARVEHYFSQFLSVIERPAPHRSLTLFSPGLESQRDPYSAWRRLPIAESVRFIGTVNVDETTHFFSPKVIDRTSLLTLEEPRLDGVRFSSGGTESLGGLLSVHWEEYRRWIGSPTASGPGFDQLVSMNEVLVKHRAGLGYRTRDRFLTYLASAEGLLSGDRAIDLAVSQMIIPRIRTSLRDFERIIEALAAQMPPGRFPRSASLLERLREGAGQVDFFQLV